MTGIVREIGKGIGRAVGSIPVKSTFLQDGKLIPAEFLAAGDRLTQLCSNWRWYA
jgi:hypothetical protein